MKRRPTPEGNTGAGEMAVIGAAFLLAVDRDVSPVAAGAIRADGGAARAARQGSALLVRTRGLPWRCADRAGEQRTAPGLKPVLSPPDPRGAGPYCKRAPPPRNPCPALGLCWRAGTDRPISTMNVAPAVT